MGMPEARLFLDFELDNGYLFLCLWNAGEGPALDPRFKFSPKLKGLRQTHVISDLAVFHKMTYFAPGKRFNILVDELGSFFEPFKRRDPVFKISVSYQNLNQEVQKFQVVHNLDIYRDLPLLNENWKSDVK